MKNMKIIYAGIIIPLMLASVFIGFVANDVIFEETKDLDSVIDRLTGKSTNPSLPEQPPEPLTGQAAYQTSTPEIPINTWLEGESVKVEYDFASFTIDYSQSDWIDTSSNDLQSPRRSLTKLGNALIDDGNEATLKFVSDIESTTYADRYQWVIPISENVPRAGTIYLESVIYVSVFLDSITYVNFCFLKNDGTGYTTKSLDVTSPFDTTDITLDIIDYLHDDGKIYGFIDTKYTTDDLNNDHQLYIDIDHFCYSPDSVTEHVRSEYLYSSGGVISQQLDFWNPSPSNIEIFLPLNWDSIEISPIIDYSLDSDNTMEIMGVPGNTFFTLRASQNSSKQYLAISTEKTYDMEGELPDHDLITSSTTYDGDYGISQGWSKTDYKGENTLNSTIVSNGAYSLRMDGNLDSPNYRAYLGFYVPYGEYYFSFDYYVESSDGAILIFAFYMAGSGTVVSALTLDQTANRWHKGFVFGNCKYTYYSQAVIAVRDTSDFVVFFDNIQFLKVNHQQETIDYSQTLFSGQLNSWTSKGLIPMPNEEINLELRDRTGDSSIKVIETMTDSQGFFYWNFQGKLLEKEYEFRSWTWDSWWNDEPELREDITEESGMLSKFYYGGFTNPDTIESISSDAKHGLQSYQLDALEDSGSDNYFTLGDYALNEWDLSNADYWVCWFKSNISLSTKPAYLIDYDSDYIRWDTSLGWSCSANIWTFIYFDLDDYSVESGTFDYTRVSLFRLDSDVSATINIKINFDAIHPVQSQKSYFTPLTTGSIDYAINEQENNPFDNYWGFDGWDFQEVNDWEAASLAYCVDSWVDDGYYNISATTTTNTWVYSMLQGLSIDSSYYNRFTIRIKGSEVNMWFGLYDSGGANIGASSGYVMTSTNWIIIDDGFDSDWGGTETAFRLNLHEPTGEGNLDGNELWYIDYIRLYHQDSDLEQGYSWEFNEDNYNDNWGEASGATINTENGYITIKQAAADTTYCLRQEIERLDTGVAQYLYFKYKATDEVQGLNIARYDLGVNYVVLSAGWAMPATSTWTYHITDLSNDPDWNGDIHYDSLGLVFISDSGAENVLEISELRFLCNIPPNLYETQTDFLIDNEGFLNYITFTDSIFSGYYTNMDFIDKNLTIGSHSFVYSAYYDYLSSGVTLPSAFYQYDYDIDETGIMKIIIHDQSGNVIPFDSMEVYIDSMRLFDNYIYFPDISQTFNLTITDLFENMLYQDTTEDFENFKEIQLTLHSIKVQNLQENPIWLNIIRDSKTFSEWIYPYEIVKYRLEAATYDFKIYYCDSLAADLGAFSTNGSWFNFQYAVSADSALMVTGNTIQDVFDNVLSLTQDLDSVNTSMHIAFEDQSQNFTLQFTATNQNITFMLGNSSLIIGNLNSNFTAILGDLILLDSNINGNFTSTFLSIAGNTTLLVNQLNSNFTNLNGLIISNNTVLYTQLVHTLADLAELKGLYRVHFSVIDGAGIGLPFETVLLNVNDSRQFDQDVYLSNNTYFEAEAFDWFDVSLWNDNFSITKRTEVNISIQLYWVLFENNGSYTSYLEIWRNNKLGVNITVAPDQTVSIRLTEGVYDYRVYYFKNDSQQTKQKDPSIYSYGRRLLSIGKFAVSALMPTKINVSTPKIKLPLIDAIMAELTLVEIIANVILTVLGLAASYFVLNFIVRRAIGRHAQDPSYVPPRDRDDWLDQLEKKAGLQTDDEGLW